MTIFGVEVTWNSRFGRPALAAAGGQPRGATTLDEVRPGQAVKISGFSQAISPERQTRLQAYGLLPGRCVHVVQHAPVTVLRVEYTELALETGLASEILVSAD